MFWVAAKLHYPSKGTPIGTIKYCSSQVASKLTFLFSDCQGVSVYADLQGFHFNDSETIPSTVLVTPCRPDVVIYSKHSSFIGIIELTCPLDSIQHIESVYQNFCQIYRTNNFFFTFLRMFYEKKCLYRQYTGF